uniref:EamA domain-containing protein n=1 Tax=Lotharella oceanica TaxID=641309 RepID=A0A7S2X590_9EUKA
MSAESKWLTGIALAATVGLAGGSTLAPLNYVPKEESGLAFLPAFGVGAMIASPLVCLIWFGYHGFVIPPLFLRETLWAGILSGTLWNLSNFCALISIPALSYSIAYPMLQCALFVAGLWGIFVFKEITGYAVLVFFVAGFILICGAVCLALSEASL